MRDAGLGRPRAAGILYGFGVLPGSVAGFATLVLFAFALYYFYVVARVALEAPANLAVALVAFNAVLSLVLGQVATRLF